MSPAYGRGRPRRDLPVPALILGSILLVAPVVLLRGPDWPCYPAAFLGGLLARAYAGRFAQLSLLVSAAAVGPFAWHLSADGRASEATAVIYDTGLAGAIEYVRLFIVSAVPGRAWVLLPYL